MAGEVGISVPWEQRAGNSVLCLVKCQQALPFPCRGGMIQTSEQYQFLHHTLALYASQLPEGGGR